MQTAYLKSHIIIVTLAAMPGIIAFSHHDSIFYFLQ